MNQQDSRHSGAAWVPAWTIGVLVLAAVLRHGTEQGNKSWMVAIGAGVLGLILTGLITVATNRAITLAHRLIAVVGCSYWMTVVAYSGWTVTRTVAVLIGAAALWILESIFAPTAAVAQVVQQVATPVAHGGQSETEAAWQALLRRLTKSQITVRPGGIIPWEKPQDGVQVHVDLPEGMTVKKLGDFADDIAGAVKLPQGCVVRVLDAAHQGAAILDVMLRDCLADTRMIDEATTAASINDEFDLATSPRGEAMTVCLREKGMIVGGTTGSGKTTLLHRIIMFLARCTDTLIWVVDFNGGGLASLWLGPYARGEAENPTIDWVGEDEIEAAIMCAIAIAIAKDRKTNRFSMRRKRMANTTVVPVDKDFPAIVVLTDEGGEIRQAIGLLAALVDQYIARIAQIGRAEGLRVIQSVLRGTGDLLEKGLRAVQGIRVCLRMDEEGEYDHVLGRYPGRVRLLHKGSAFMYRTDRDYRPVLVRTVNVDVETIERHAIATAHLRPKLDDRAKLIASRVTVADVLDGRDPRDPKFAELLEHPAFLDVAAGLAYENRWKRVEAMLAQLRDEDLPEDDDDPQPRPTSAPTSVAPPGSALGRLAAGAGVAVDQQPRPAAATSQQDEPSKATIPTQPQPQSSPQVEPEDVEAVAQALLSDAHLAVNADPVRPRIDAPTASTELVPLTDGRPPNARQAILVVVHGERDMLTATQIRTRIFDRWGVDVTKQRVGELLGKLVEQGELVRDDKRAGGPYYGLEV